MKIISKSFLAFTLVGGCGLAGWWLARAPAVPATPAVLQPVKLVSRNATLPVPMRARPIPRDEFQDGSAVEMFSSSSPDEVILRFPSEETYGEFLFALAGSRIHLVDQLDPLRAVRLAYDEWVDLANLLDGENIFAYDSMPAVPAPGPERGSPQAGLVGFYDGVLDWLGVTADHAQWGAGVRIAVLDTGILPHPALPGLSRSIAITPFPEDLGKTNGHGTAVASLAAGVAPAAEFISIRVGDDSGRADSFALAAGILAAVDAGAQIINISMGTTEDNPLIREAVLHAHDHQVLIVAAAGNSERAEATYPAAYPTVISVGAVDARGEHLDFSNYGTYLSLTAPGYAIDAAWPGNRIARVSGTSASAPLVSGAIAATMSSHGGPVMSARQAAEIVMSHSNEAGIPGPDSEYGVGILNLARVMNRGLPGIVDAAITHQRLVGEEIEVTVQNRGTTVLVNTLLEISTPFGSRQFNASTLVPGAIRTFSMPARMPDGGKIRVRSSLVLGTPGQDITPRNNWRDGDLRR